MQSSSKAEAPQVHSVELKPDSPNNNHHSLNWDALSVVVALTYSMCDEPIARAVIKRYPDLQVPDSHGAAIYAARCEAAKGIFDDGLEAHARIILAAKSFEDEIASQALEILERIDKSPSSTNSTVSIALHQAQRIFRMANPLFSATDAGNGERFAFHNYPCARYVAEWKKWIAWNDKQWEIDKTGVTLRLAKETARRIVEEAKGAPHDKYSELLKWAIKSESNERLNAMLRQAASEEGITLKVENLDTPQTSKYLFNCQNGTLNLKTGELLPHNPDDFLTQISPVSYDPKAKCPSFLSFLSKIFGGNNELISYLQRVVGYSLTGETNEQILLVLHGAGSNGKSVLMRILMEMFGRYYGHTMEPSTISTRSAERMPTDIADLYGKRFVSCSETDEGRSLGEAIIKRFTGGEEITGERKFEDRFTFTPQFQVFFCTNHKPEIRGTDHGIWRRIQLLPFNVTFWDEKQGEAGLPELKADPELFNKLCDELPGILKWAVDGCLEWQKHRLKAPSEVIMATTAYREEQDRMGEFFGASCILSPSASVPAGELYQAWCKWAETNNERAMSQTKFGRQMRERGFEQDKKNKKLPYLGIGLLKDDNSHPMLR